MTTHIHGVVRDNHQVKCAWRDRSLATRAQVLLARLIGLDGTDGYVENNAHAISASAVPTASTTIAMSSSELFCWRNGLNPIPETVTVLSACLPSSL